MTPDLEKAARLLKEILAYDDLLDAADKIHELTALVEGRTASRHLRLVT